MADKSINDLPVASSIGASDLFVVQQSSTAKSVTGAVFLAMVEAHGGISSVTQNADYTLTFTFADGTTWTSTSIRGATGATGATGNGIASITKTSTVGNVDTYTITFTDSTTTTFTVTNGSGSGDMTVASYDTVTESGTTTHPVATAGGIPQYFASKGLPYIDGDTAMPTSANTDGIKIVVCSTTPSTPYDGYLYLVTS